jgi:hypothetical protein
MTVQDLRTFTLGGVLQEKGEQEAQKEADQPGEGRGGECHADAERHGEGLHSRNR